MIDSESIKDSHLTSCVLQNYHINNVFTGLRRQEETLVHKRHIETFTESNSLPRTGTMNDYYIVFTVVRSRFKCGILRNKDENTLGGCGYFCRVPSDLVGWDRLIDQLMSSYSLGSTLVEYSKIKLLKRVGWVPSTLHC